MMKKKREGEQVPQAAFKILQGGLRDLSTTEVFAGKRVVLFSLPGAYTPTCSSSHVPRYEELAPLFFERGVDDIVCVSVNDAFVMAAWGRDQGVHHVKMLADGNGVFTRGMGLLVDKSALGFGERSWRYAMVVDDGVITKLFIEEEVPGDPYDVSDADTVLGWIAPDLTGPRDIVLLTKPGCGHCARAREALRGASLAFEEIQASPRRLRALTQRSSTPQVFIDGAHVGGADELVAWLADRS